MLAESHHRQIENPGFARKTLLRYFQNIISKTLGWAFTVGERNSPYHRVQPNLVLNRIRACTIRGHGW